MPDPITLTLAAAGLSAALLVAWLASFLRVPGTAAGEDAVRDRLPLWWRVSAPLSRPLAARVAPLMSAR